MSQSHHGSAVRRATIELVTIQLAELRIHGRSFRVARASRADVPELVSLLADDVIGTTREGADLAPYLAAFEAIDRDRAQLLVTVRDEENIVATMQLTLRTGPDRSDQ